MSFVNLLQLFINKFNRFCVKSFPHLFSLCTTPLSTPLLWDLVSGILNLYVESGQLLSLRTRNFIQFIQSPPRVLNMKIARGRTLSKLYFPGTECEPLCDDIFEFMDKILFPCKISKSNFTLVTYYDYNLQSYLYMNSRTIRTVKSMYSPLH